MGCVDSICDSDEAPIHSVQLDDFYLGAYEVTNSQYCDFLNAHLTDTTGLINKWINVNENGNDNCKIYKDSSVYKVESGFENHPVAFVSWYGAKAYCDWKDLRLPTEAEWEYCARSGGKDYMYSCGNGEPNLKKGGNIADETYKTKFDNPKLRIWEGYEDGFVKSAPVGSFSPNELGLYDMTGNVTEWCNDYYSKDFYSVSDDLNPIGPDSGKNRVVRDGAWRNDPKSIRTTNKKSVPANMKFWLMGFRVAKDAD